MILANQLRAKEEHHCVTGCTTCFEMHACRVQIFIDYIRTKNQMTRHLSMHVSIIVHVRHTYQRSFWVCRMMMIIGYEYGRISFQVCIRIPLVLSITRTWKIKVLNQHTIIWIRVAEWRETETEKIKDWRIQLFFLLTMIECDILIEWAV